MPHFLDGVVNQYGRPVPNVGVTVYLPGTTTLATIYSDELITQKTNPFTADAYGMLDFYAVVGNYDVALSGGSPAITPVKYTVTVGAQAGSGVTQAKVISTGSIPAGQAATVTVTWDAPFGNANYKVSVNLLESVSPGAGGLRILQLEALTTTNIKVRVVNDDDTNAHTGTLYALAF